jgi:hypothetical protein
MIKLSLSSLQDKYAILIFIEVAVHLFVVLLAVFIYFDLMMAKALKSLGVAI